MTSYKNFGCLMFTFVNSVLIGCTNADFQSCNSVNNKYNCYYKPDNNIVLSWYSAYSFCQNRGYDLPIVADPDSEATLSQFLKDSNISWVTWFAVRQNYINSSSEWHWISNSSNNNNNNNKQSVGENIHHLYDDSFDDSEPYSAIGVINNSLVVYAKHWYERLSYVCQYNNDTSCNEGFFYNSNCYRIYCYSANWFYAARQCVLSGGSLATFDDNFLENLNKSLISGLTWIGLVKSWWTWPDGDDLQYNDFYQPMYSMDYIFFRLPAAPNRVDQCITSYWRAISCDADIRFVCQITNSTTTATTTTTETTSTLYAPDNSTDLQLSNNQTSVNTAIFVVCVLDERLLLLLLLFLF